jgi:hypothetical protein
MSPAPSAQPTAPKISNRARGLGRVLVTVYAILAIGATSRAIYQMATVYSSARIPITLSAVSGVIYILATLALILPGRSWYRVAWITISFELLGVLVIGTLSLVDPAIFAGSALVADGTVWSYYGRGYLFIPVVLPVLGLLWLRKHPPVGDEVGSRVAAAAESAG